MNQEEQEKEAIQKSGEGQTRTSVNSYPPEFVEAIRQAAFTTLAVLSVHGFYDLKVSFIREVAENVYAARFTYEKMGPTGNILTEVQGLYIDQFAQALYLDGYALSIFIQEMIDFHTGRLPIV